MREETAMGWEKPLTILSLPDNAVDVWRIPIGGEDWRLETLKSLLSSEELSRADRFHFARDRHAFVVAHAALRSILARYAARDPLALDVRFGPYGKPELVGDPGGLTLRFNLSHSGSIALLGVTRKRNIGIDVEQIRSGVGIFEIAKRFFSLSEVSELEALPPTLRERAFFRTWTSKEAYIKARGEGLSFPLGDFDVQVKPDRPVALCTTRKDPHEARRWTLRDIVLDDQYVAAVAVEGEGWMMRCWQWNPQDSESRWRPAGTDGGDYRQRAVS
jgi:4'-phosphopantetheinyl transferase